MSFRAGDSGERGCFAWGQTREPGLADKDFSIRVMPAFIFAFSRLASFARRTKSPELSR